MMDHIYEKLRVEMSPEDEDEENYMLINEFKIKWFTLVSRVDAAPTVDEVVLTSLNSIASILATNHHQLVKLYRRDLLFDLSLKLDIFEVIFKWNFLFSGNDLELFKDKELQFYDTLVTECGNHYLTRTEFVVPLIATLHYGSNRSSLAVERTLLRTLNAVCAALASLGTINKPLNHHHHQGATTSSQDHNLFRWLCMGLVGQSSSISTTNSQLEHEDKNKKDSDTAKLRVWNRRITPGHFEKQQQQSRDSMPKLLLIDSILDLLVHFVHRERELSWQARDALLLAATYSLKDEEFSAHIACFSSFCPLIATQASMFYAHLPNRLIQDNSPNSWPDLRAAADQGRVNSIQFANFYDAIDFCESVLEVAHPIIQSALLKSLRIGFLQAIVGRSLVQPKVEEVVTATIYLEQLLTHTAKTPILSIIIRFLLADAPDTSSFDQPRENGCFDETRDTGCSESSGSLVSHSDTLTDSVDLQHRTYLDLLISRLHYCNTLLGVATLSLFNTLINLNCEEVMLQLVFKHLIPFRDSLQQRMAWSRPGSVTYSKVSTDFLNLIPDYSGDSVSKSSESITTDDRHHSSDDEGACGQERASIAELNLDDVGDAQGHSVLDDVFQEDLVKLKPVKKSIRDSLKLTKIRKKSKSKSSIDPTKSPLTSESLDSPVMQGINIELLDNNNDFLEPKTSRIFPSIGEMRQRSTATAILRDPFTPDLMEQWIEYSSWAKKTLASRLDSCSKWHFTYSLEQPSESQTLDLLILQQQSGHVQSHLHSLYCPFNTTEDQRSPVQPRASFDANIELEMEPVFSSEVSSSSRVSLDSSINQNVVLVHSIGRKWSSELSFIRHKSFEGQFPIEKDYCLLPNCRQRSQPLLKQMYKLYYNDDSSLEANSKFHPIKYPYEPEIGEHKRTRFDKEIESEIEHKLNSFIQSLEQIDDPPPGKLSDSDLCLDRIGDYLTETLEEIRSRNGVDSRQQRIDCVDQHSSYPSTESLSSSLDPGLLKTLPRESGSHSNIESPSLDSIVLSQVGTRLNAQDISSMVEYDNEVDDLYSDINHLVDLTGDWTPVNSNVKNASYGSSSCEFLEKLTYTRVTPCLFGPTGRKSISSERSSIQRKHSYHQPPLGSFLTTIMTRLECMPHNCFYANLYLTSLLTSLASFHQPLLQAIIFYRPATSIMSPESKVRDSRDVEVTNQVREACQQLPYIVMSSIKRQLDQFTANYDTGPRGVVGSGKTTSFQPSFGSLVADARLFFQSRVTTTSDSNQLAKSMLRFGRHCLVRPVELEKDVSVKPSESAVRKVFSPRKRNKISVGNNKSNPTTSSSCRANQSSPVYDWLPEFLFPNSHQPKSKGPRKLKSKQLVSREARRPLLQRMILTAVIFEEFCKEMAALCSEHSISVTS